MEERPKYLLSPEDEDDDEEDDDDNSSIRSITKNRPLSEAMLNYQNRSKQRVSKDIAKSIFEAKDSFDKKSPEQDLPNELSAEEEVLVNKTIASDHLTHPITEVPLVEPVIDFLDQVVEGTQPPEAFESIVQQNGLEKNVDDLIEEDNSIIIDEHSVDDRENSGPLILLGSPNDDPNLSRDYLHPHPTTEPEQVINQLPTHSSETVKTSPGKTAEKPVTKGLLSSTVLATDIASYLLGERRGKKQAKEQSKKVQRKLEKKVQEMELDITQKELVIQQAYFENRASQRHIIPTERTQLGRSETRLDLKKPKTVEHLGKIMVVDKHPERVAVVKEKMIKPNNLRQYYRPEYVRTMKRQELMAISEKIIVEGASLKHMYDNGLFSERALRRLVIEYVQDRDIVPKLRREILEKQIDYERDPLLRDSYNRDVDVRGETQSVFDQMLSRVETTNQPKPNLEKPKDQRSDNKKSPQLSRQASNLLANVLLILLIVFLIGLIIYLLQRG